MELCMKPLIAITMGDAAGIGPEVTVKALLTGEVRDLCRAVVIGNAGIIEKQCSSLDTCGLGVPSVTVRSIDDLEKAKDAAGVIDVLDPGSAGLEGIEYGRAQESCGRAAAGYVKRAVGLALQEKVKAVVTAPWCKESICMAGYDCGGHTEFIAELAGVDDYAMMIAGGSLRTVLVTRHIPIGEVPATLTEEKVFRAIMLADRSLKGFGVAAPRIAVAALNPHAGENGLIGSEEKDIILPAVERAGREGVDVKGPLPADRAMYDTAGSRYDIVVAMYHDQALIPVKLIAFNRGINVTLGLPFIRTSPCHGTAFDIAGRNRADSRSMAEAIKFAVKHEKAMGTEFSG